MSYLAVVPLVVYVALLDSGLLPHSTLSAVLLLTVEAIAVPVTARALWRRYKACYERQRAVRYGRHA